MGYFFIVYFDDDDDDGEDVFEIDYGDVSGVLSEVVSLKLVLLLLLFMLEIEEIKVLLRRSVRWKVLVKFKVVVVGGK